MTDTWGDKPISMIKAKGEGPIYRDGGAVMLAPGRYGYTATDTKPFLEWRTGYGSTYVVITSSEAEKETQPVLTWIPFGEDISEPGIIYTDFVFTVKQPVAWVGPGLPTWFPAGLNVEQYFEKGYRAPDTITVIEDVVPTPQQLVGGIQTIAVLGILGLGAFLVMKLAKESPRRETA